MGLVGQLFGVELDNPPRRDPCSVFLHESGRYPFRPAGLSMVGGRLLWYRFEDKDCRVPDDRRCDWVAAAGVASLASGLLLMTVLADIPASQAVTFTPRPGGGVIRAVVGF